MPPTVRQQFSRPQLADILAHQNASAVARYIAQVVLRASPLLQVMTFDNTTVANVRQRMIAFSYTRRQVARAAQLRAFNTDYKPAFSGGETDHTTQLKVIGDAFEIDRVFGDADPEFVDEQITAMAPGITSKLCDLIVNGDVAANVLEMDGLNKILTTAGRTLAGLSLDTGTGTDANRLTLRKNLGRVTAEIRRIRALGLNPVILCNADVIAALELAADVFGARADIADFYNAATVSTIAGAPLIDVGVTNILNAADVTANLPNPRVESAEIIPTDAGVSDIYVVGMSRTNGFTGLTLDGSRGTSPVRYSTAPADSGVMRRYEFELVAGCALLDERAAVKFDDVALGA